MKRYPFSKKAVQAILAATLILTPAAGVSAAQAETVGTENIVNAAAYNKGDLVSKFSKVYSALKRNDDLQKIKNAQAKIEQLNWNTYADRILVPDDSAKVAILAVLLEDIAKFATSTTAGELNQSLKQLSTDSANIATALGGNISATDIEDLIIGAAIEYYDRLKELGPNATEAEYNAALKAAVKAVYTSNIAGNAKYENLVAVFFRNISLGEVEKVLGEVAAQADPGAEARKAFARAIKRAEDGSSGGGGGGGSSDPDPDKVDPIPYTPGAGEAKVPADAATSEKIVTNGKTQYVTTISTQKVDTLVGLISDSSPVLVLPLPQAAAGEVNKALIPGAFFTKATGKNVNAALFVKTTEAGYKLPVHAITINEFAQKLGVSADDVQIEISVNIVDVKDVQGTISKNKLNPVSKVIEFTVKAKAGGKEQLISTFKTYVEREIVGDKVFNPKHTAALRLNDNGTTSPVPATYKGRVASIKSPSNSKYVIVENDKTFNDVNNGANFFEENIEKLASKYIINGKTETSYAPSANITRGEFAALVSRGLGLVANNINETRFSDVSTNQAVNKNGEINAAVEAGIIQGFPGGQFKPNQPITRAEAAIMIDRAMQFTSVPASKLDSSRKVTEFKDAAGIGVSSRNSIERVVQAGIMDGFQNGEFGAYKHTQRDQMAKVLDKFLQASNLID